MTSKSISITEEVYDLLDKFRLKNESFSQTILRLLKKQENLLELAGAWKKIPDVDSALKVVEKVTNQAHDSNFDNVKLV